jgi:hypothetical protein
MTSFAKYRQCSDPSEVASASMVPLSFPTYTIRPSTLKAGDDRTKYPVYTTQRDAPHGVNEYMKPSSLPTYKEPSAPKVTEASNASSAVKRHSSAPVPP